jgi:uncharacterized protein (TIGR02246 family)
MSEDARSIATQILRRMQDAWNQGDATAFGKLFASDVSFVDIRGDLHHGRVAVTHGHRAILDTIYKGSTVRYDLNSASQLSDDIIVAHSRALMRAPTGPLAGENHAVQTLVLARTGADWLIAAFHNTLAPR